MSYSDYKKDKLIMENWRRFLNEGPVNEVDPRLERPSSPASYRAQQFAKAFNDAAAEDKVRVLLRETIMKSEDVFCEPTNGKEAFIKIFKQAEQTQRFNNIDISDLDILNKKACIELITAHIPNIDEGTLYGDYSDDMKGFGHDGDTIMSMIDVIHGSGGLLKQPDNPTAASNRGEIEQSKTGRTVASQLLCQAALEAGVLARDEDSIIVKDF